MKFRKYMAAITFVIVASLANSAQAATLGNTWWFSGTHAWIEGGNIWVKLVNNTSNAGTNDVCTQTIFSTGWPTSQIKTRSGTRHTGQNNDCLVKIPVSWPYRNGPVQVYFRNYDASSPYYSTLLGTAIFQVYD